MESPYGRCIYKCDNDVVDHQSVLINFESGATGTHNLTGGSAESLRTIRVIGTRGEIYGELENKFVKIKNNLLSTALTIAKDTEAKINFTYTSFEIIFYFSYLRFYFSHFSHRITIDRRWFL